MHRAKLLILEVIIRLYQTNKNSDADCAGRLHALRLADLRAETITTRTRMLVPRNNVPEQLDVLSAMYQPTIGNVIEEDLLLDAMNSEDAYA